VRRSLAVAIASAEVKEFTAFAGVHFEFVPGLNVFLGENGTGKSHALKVLYACLESMRAARRDGAALPAVLEAKLAGVFRPRGGAVSRLLRRKQGQTASRVRLSSTQGSKLTADLSVRGGLRTTGGWRPNRAVFLPTCEVLSIFPGFVALYDERELAFDETYRDVCAALAAPALRGPKLARVDQLTDLLRSAIGGRTEQRPDGFYVKALGDRALMEAHLVAEGLRKVAVVERLLVNGTLMKQGYLFWDEPEANLNPKLTIVVAELLLSLAEAKVQVFIATHDYLLLKELELRARRRRGHHARFFLFDRRQVGAAVVVASADDLVALPRNPIAEEFVALYQRQVSSDERSRA
jgi:ABC-type branched-subunit amino acid transport system ATPase component